MPHPESYQLFVEMLRQELTFELADPAPRAPFAALGLDSIDVLEIVVVLEDRGVHVDDEDLHALETLGDLHDAFERAYSHATSAGGRSSSR